MSNKRKLSTVLGICVATAVASGGSIFLTAAGLSLVDKEQQIEQETELGSGSVKETEAPITVEQFAKTKDSFVVSAKKTRPAKEGETGEKADSADGDNSSVGSANSGGSQSSGSSSGSSGSSSSGSGSGGSDSGIKYDENGGYYDSNGNYYDGNGGYYAPNGNYYSSDGTYSDPYGNWYDGSGGYYDVNGNYHTGTYDPNSGSSGGGSSDNSSGTSSSGGSSSGWDDSYMLYDINQRYISEDELSGWSLSDLAKLRNEIFARHGRVFTTQKWIDYFSQKSWYVPTYDASYFDDNMGSFLNDYEWKNLNVILKLEEKLS
ncbi:MAG: YARHG domain-containing protein [Eubacteriales bacterium]|nr:YARHG domain-containing protein [Eubacteriales bacterium]